MDSVNMTPIRLGVIGTGVMGADHVETISKSIARAEVRAVADIDVGRAQTVAARVPGAKAVHEIDVMPWVFGREVVCVQRLSPVPPAPGVRRDPQVAILELDEINK
jgi:Oxidoreductase family, NAD-binding Rossmann fold